MQLWQNEDYGKTRIRRGRCSSHAAGAILPGPARTSQSGSRTLQTAPRVRERHVNSTLLQPSRRRQMSESCNLRLGQPDPASAGAPKSRALGHRHRIIHEGTRRLGFGRVHSGHSRFCDSGKASDHPAFLFGNSALKQSTRGQGSPATLARTMPGPAGLHNPGLRSACAF